MDRTVEPQPLFKRSGAQYGEALGLELSRGTENFVPEMRISAHFGAGRLRREEVLSVREWCRPLNKRAVIAVHLREWLSEIKNSPTGYSEWKLDSAGRPGSAANHDSGD